jgi:D-alanyl-D-alanine carboxypeptidase/D-alanyl-D-alanine-endopeptidase (penicillin-binding protein 4)
MKLLHLFFIAALAFAAHAEDLPPSVREALRQANIPVGSIGVVVREVSSPVPLIQINGTRGMNPASTMKLLTTYAALELLGPAYTWKTEAYLDGTLANGVLNGNLAIKGYGNPKMNAEHLWLWLRELRNRGLKEISGDLILDHSAFSQQDIDPAIFDNDPVRAYNVPPDALLLNFNAIRFRFVPVNDGVTVFTEPSLGSISLDNRLTLRKQNNCRNWDGNIQIQLAGDTIKLTGSYPALCGERDKAISLLPHTRYFDAVFRSLWQEMGGVLSGKTRDGTATNSATLFSTHYSQPLSELIRDINKYSNNVMARQLLLSLSLNVTSPSPVEDMEMEIASMPQATSAPASTTPPASIALSEIALRRWLNSKELNFPELVLENGAGLSRRERISPLNLSLLLQSINASPYSAELEASLPIIGIDGTIKRRLDNHAVTSHAHLKTGSLEGVKSIAGYVQSRSGKQWVLVFIINHSNASAGQRAQDELIEWLEKSY